MEVCTEYKAEHEYCGVDWELVKDKYEQIKEKLIQHYPKNSTNGFSKSENMEQTRTVKCISGKLKIIRTNFKKAVDTHKRTHIVAETMTNSVSTIKCKPHRMSYITFKHLDMISVPNMWQNTSS